MLKLAADENFDGKILRGILRYLPDLDVVRIQDTLLYGAGDPEILEWAAQEQRVLLTHDINTLIGFAYDRIREGKYLAGVLEVHDDIPVGQAIENIVLMIECSFDHEWENQVRYVIR